jgi:hypothetical protein
VRRGGICLQLAQNSGRTDGPLKAGADNPLAVRLTLGHIVELLEEKKIFKPVYTDPPKQQLQGRQDVREYVRLVLERVGYGSVAEGRNVVKFANASPTVSPIRQEIFHQLRRQRLVGDSLKLHSVVALRTERVRTRHEIRVRRDVFGQIRGRRDTETAHAQPVDTGTGRGR